MKALLVVDVQYDFCPGGALGVADGDAIVPGINARMDAYDLVVVTQDWHPANHHSFASQHDGHDPYDMIDMPYGPQVLWPDHCIQGSRGAALHDDLNTDRAALVIRKGMTPTIDSYSAFLENDKRTTTGLHGFFNDKGVTEIAIVGLATDFCVAYSAMNASAYGYRVKVIQSLTRAIDLDGTLNAALTQMTGAGVEIV
ncbi:MAG: bifunctional nicotinamidase/pyrazinamidase [Paracoccaceae bacterium]